LRPKYSDAPAKLLSTTAHVQLTLLLAFKECRDRVTTTTESSIGNNNNHTLSDLHHTTSLA
jgi:hypothetical protein